MGTNNQCKQYFISIDNAISVPSTKVPRATKAMACTETLRNKDTSEIPRVPGINSPKNSHLGG